MAVSKIPSDGKHFSRAEHHKNCKIFIYQIYSQCTKFILAEKLTNEMHIPHKISTLTYIAIFGSFSQYFKFFEKFFNVVFLLLKWTLGATWHNILSNNVFL